MSRKIGMLKITNFVGIPDAELHFQKPVSVFIGKNNQGKSSIIDALMFAFTGKSRAITKFKDIPQLIHGGAQPKKTMQIHVNYTDTAGELCIIKRSPSTASRGIDPNPFISLCLDTMSFINMTPPERGKILASVLGSGLNDIIKAAIAKHIGDFPQEIIGVIKGNGINVLDVDAVRDEVVLIRRGYKRDASELDVLEPTLTSYQLPENYTVDTDEKKLESLAKDRELILDKLNKVKERNRVEADIFDAGKEKKRIESEIQDEPGRFDKDTTDIRIAELSIQLSEAIGEKYLEHDVEINCPICDNEELVDQMVCNADKWKKFLAQYKDLLATRNAVIAKNEKLKAELSHVCIQLTELKAELDKLPKRVLEDFASDLEKLNDREAVLKDNIDKYRNYKTQQLQVVSNKKRFSILDNLIKECDRIDDALKDGGPVKTEIAASGRTLPINEKLLAVWDMTGLELKDNGEITYNGRPIEQASKSERYRASSVFSLALSQIADVGFAALDEYETLVGENANRFFDVVTECGLKNVFVCISRGKDLPVSEVPKYMEVFKVENGKVTPIPR